MQYLNYGFWNDWLEPQKVTFDGPNRRIIVNSGVTDLDIETDVYSAWKEWVLQYDHGKFLPAFRSVGGDPTVGGRALGATFFLINGWRVRTWEGHHRLQVVGNLFTDEGDAPFVDTVFPWTITIESTVSSLIDRLGFIPDAETTAAAVWGEVVADATAKVVMQRVLKLMQNKTVTDPSTGKYTVYDDDGATVLFEGDLYEDADGTQPYRGQGAERRERLT